MRLRFRFVIYFSLLFSALMLCSVFIIYFLLERARDKDFDTRMWAQAYASYHDWYHVPLTDSIENIVGLYHSNTMTRLQVVAFNSTGNVEKIFDTQNTVVVQELQKLTRKKTPFFRTLDSVQQMCIYVPSATPKYIVVSAFDMFGWLRLKNFRRILGFVMIIGVVFIVCSAFLISNLVKRPLTRLGLQMQGISESNFLKERLQIKPGRLNHEESQIAIHFNAMLDRLERAFELQRSFVHHASHELRTPIASMLLQTELALSKNLTIEDARKVFESLKEDQQEMVELTNSLLLLSQYERSNTSQQWPVLRLDELLYETMGMVKRMLPNVNVSLEFAQVPENELFLSIQGNDSLIRSAFRNLIKNAWLYSDNKSVAVTIDATSTDIYLHFDNNGKLLSLEEQERLFIPFFRASNSASKKGSGLGLNIIQRIVTMHKGNVNYIIYNNLNRFTLQFPKLSSTMISL